MPPLVRTEEWTKPLPDGFETLNILHKFVGAVVGFSVILIRQNADGTRDGITRYDTAHDCVHRDVLGRKAADEQIDKIWYYDLTLAEGFLHADQDFSENYAEYAAFYDSH